MADTDLKTVIIGLAEDENAAQNFRQEVGMGGGGGAQKKVRFRDPGIKNNLFEEV